MTLDEITAGMAKDPDFAPIVAALADGPKAPADVAVEGVSPEIVHARLHYLRESGLVRQTEFTPRGWLFALVGSQRP